MKATKESLDYQFSGERIEASPIRYELASVMAGRSPITSIPWVNPSNAHVTNTLSEIASKVIYDRSKDEEKEALQQMLIDSVGNPHVAQELAAYRQFEVMRGVLAVPFAFGGFQSVNLSANEQALIRRPQKRQYFNVRYRSADGGYRGDQWRTTRQVDQVLMELIGTDVVECPLMDLQLGDINEFDRVNSQLAYDFDLEIDTLAKEAIDDAKTTSGLRDVLDLHPQIIAANVPDTNYLDLTNTGTYGTAHVLTITRIKAILNHIAQFGVGIDPEVPQGLSPQSFQISPQNLRDMWDYVDLVSGYSGGATVDPAKTVPTPVREEIFRTGTMNSAWGYTWATVPNARIDIGRLYVLTNQPIGWMFTKSEFDKTIRYDGPEWIRRNVVGVEMQKALKFYTVDEWKHRVVIVDF